MSEAAAWRSLDERPFQEASYTDREALRQRRALMSCSPHHTWGSFLEASGFAFFSSLEFGNQAAEAGVPTHELPPGTRGLMDEGPKAGR